MQHLRTPIIYNLFPRLAGPINQWPQHAAHAATLGFNWIYLNPITYPGYSGSLYATKDYYQLNPDFVKESASDLLLNRVQSVIREIRNMGIHVMIDLVINHTAIDSPLVADHPEWYVRDANGEVQHPYAVDPDDPTKQTVWGDLAEINNEFSPDGETLWEFWAALVEAYLDLGFEGFRCDAAYKVPSTLWRFLIDRARRRHPHAVFWAENLGCTLEQTRALRESGFQFFCNSSKWWNFQDAWCLDQHREFEDIPSISFPETHDTERLAKESGGNEAVQRQRYAFSATFSSGVMMPIGYEWGFQRTLHVVKTRPVDWESPQFDLCEFIQAVNALKIKTPLFQGEGKLQHVRHDQDYLLVLRREAGFPLDEPGWIIVNRDTHHCVDWSSRDFPLDTDAYSIIRLSWLDHQSVPEGISDTVKLAPAEVICLIGKRVGDFEREWFAT